MEPTLEFFAEQRHRRFGSANPERMALSHWEWMVRNSLGPYQALKHFGAELDTANGPDGCFTPRYGMSSTELHDGRTIYVGGEYEDWYDEEFCIYYDVIVLGRNDEVVIYGYPKADFPPTDFHTATLIEQRIILIGCLGYFADRRPEYTPAFALDTQTYRIERLETTGENPGWIFKHSAVFDPVRRSIVVAGGEIDTASSPDEQTRENASRYELNLQDRCWRRLHSNPQAKP